MLSFNGFFFGLKGDLFFHPSVADLDEQVNIHKALEFENEHLEYLHYAIKRQIYVCSITLVFQK